MLELFDTKVSPNNWCIPRFDNVIKTKSGIEYEIGIYKEEDGTLTLQVFANDDLIICESL